MPRCTHIGMKNAKDSKGRPAAKGRGSPNSVDAYLAGVAEPARTSLQTIRAIIRSAVPREATEIISYRIPAFYYKGVLVWFAAFSDHCSFFPAGAVIKKFKSELKDFSTSKGTIRFTVDRPLPASLVRRMVKARVAQNKSKKRR